MVQVALFVFELSGSSLAAARRPPPFFTMVAEVVAWNSGAVALRKRKGAGAGKKKLERKGIYRGVATVFMGRDSKSQPLL